MCGMVMGARLYTHLIRDCWREACAMRNQSDTRSHAHAISFKSVCDCNEAQRRHPAHEAVHDAVVELLATGVIAYAGVSARPQGSLSEPNISRARVTNWIIRRTRIRSARAKRRRASRLKAGEAWSVDTQTNAA